MAELDPLRQGYDALAAGDWSEAETVFGDAVRVDPTPEALDGLGLARWWRKDVRGGIELRTRAYRGFVAADRTAEAAAVAVWLAREHRASLGNVAVANGWLRRAATLVPADDSASSGWVALARSEAAPEQRDALRLSLNALDLARRHGDLDLQIESLARTGLLAVAAGDVAGGTDLLDEAMAMASAGDASDLRTVGTAYCAMTDATGLLGDEDRLAQWSEVLTRYGTGQGFGPLDGGATEGPHGSLAVFCGACCGGMHLVTGRLDDAEATLLAAIAELRETGLASRCVHPVTQLAELRVLQGRFEEARALLDPYADLAEAVRPLAALEIALGAPEEAAARLTEHLSRLGRGALAAVPWLALLVDAAIASAQAPVAREASDQLHAIAARTASRRHRGEAALAAGKVALAGGEAGAAELLREAARLFADSSMALAACRARMLLARTLAGTDVPVAITEARAALAAFDRLGAVADADAAAAFLRKLGVRGRTGPKDHRSLSAREREVLRLVALGLSNHEIAERLYISPKTAGHHVSSILAKLGLRSRTEAAAYAAVHLHAEPAQG
jgi:DNA-binding NarL/FixJ family response regulator